MRLAFLGTPAAAVPSLHALVEAGHEVAVVITMPDRRRGRGGATQPSPVKIAAEALGISVDYDLGALDAYDIERAVVVAYGALIPAALLDRVPMLNVHFSLLPRWRGAAPVERAILAGDDETGVSVMTLEATLDTGPVHVERRVQLENQTVSELLGQLADLGAGAVVEVLGSPELLAKPQPQVGAVTYAAKLDAETFHLSPAMTVVEVMRMVRLERAFLLVGERRLRIYEVRPTAQATVSGTLSLADGEVVLGAADGTMMVVTVQPEGGRRMAAKDWWSGARLSNEIQWH